MDINFHYFAVKVIAVMAGYSDDEADTIATFSEYVDDYFDNSSFRTQSRPPFQTPVYNAVTGKVYPVQTGIETSKSMWESHQKEVIIPFHFIPSIPLSRAGEGYRTVPGRWDPLDRKLIVEMLRTLIETRSNHPGFLVFSGMLLHIFADTYAHQSFNGFHNKNMNDGWVSNATAYYGDGTKRNKSYSGYAGLPAIGHAVLGSAPDETALVYTCYRNDGTGNIKKQKERVNAFEFLNCAHEILKILRAARAASAPTEAEFGMLDRALGEGFGIDCSRSIRELCTHWSQKVPSINGRNINYSYDKDAVHDSILFIAADSLPEGMSEQRARELLSVKEMDDETEKELERLTATNALRPTRTYYYYNTCAYYIRKMVNQ